MNYIPVRWKTEGFTLSKTDGNTDLIGRSAIDEADEAKNEIIER